MCKYVFYIKKMFNKINVKQSMQYLEKVSNKRDETLQ